MTAPNQLHLHLETARSRPAHLHLTKESWQAAAQRHPDLAAQLRVTIGWDGEILDEALRTADFMINQYPPREGLRSRAPRLKWIQTTGAGLDAILPLDWLPSDMTLTNNRGAHGDKAEDSCTMAMLLIHTRLAEMMANQRSHVWEALITPTIAGRTAVILGFGDLGQGAGRAAKKLGLRVIAVTRTGKSAAPADEARSVAELDAVLPLADFVVVTTPLLPETRGLLDHKRVALLKRGAGLINFGRAAIVDYEALRARLDRGELAGAVLDVFDQEPLPADSPYWDTRNLVVLPHVSCDTPGYIDRLLDAWFENFKRFLAGEPLQNTVDHRLGY